MRQWFDARRNSPIGLFLGKWTRLGAGAGAGQVAIQATGFISGIGIIRLLPEAEYAYYTLANTMLGTMNILADGGIAAGVTALGGQVYRSRGELGTIVNTGLGLRNQFAAVCCLVVLPIIYLLYAQQAIGTVSILVIIACLVPTFITTLSSSLYRIVPQLHQRLKPIVRIGVEINVARIILSVLPLLMIPYAAVALLGTGVAQFWGNLKYKRLMVADAAMEAPRSPEAKTDILKVVRRVLPTSIYYCISGQISIWLLSIFGSTAGLAQIGALGRLMVVFTIVQTTVDLLVSPRFARLPEGDPKLLPRFFQVLAVATALCGVIVAAVVLVPNLLLMVLGDTYRGLEFELLLVTVSASLTLVSGLINKLSSSRGVVPNPVLFIGSQILIQVIMIAFVIDYRTLIGVLTMSIAVVATTVTVRLGHFVLQDRRRRHANPPAESLP